MPTSFDVRTRPSGPAPIPVGAATCPPPNAQPARPALGGGSALPRPRPRVFAHRGASGVFPEHTRAAYTQALNEGSDGVEIDLHLTADGELVCFHDATLERTTDGFGSVATTTLAEMRRLDIASWKTPRLPEEYGRVDEQLMTLQDVLELLISAGRDVELAIELKHPSPFGHQLEDRALKVLLSYGWDPDTSQIPVGQHSVEISFMSFFSGSLLHLAELVPAGNLCALVTDLTAEAVNNRLGRRRMLAPFKPLVTALMRSSLRDTEALAWKGQMGMAGPGLEYVRRQQASAAAWLASGRRLRVWTVDAVDDLDMLIGLGVQEITTNYPSRILNHVSA